MGRRCAREGESDGGEGGVIDCHDEADGGTGESMKWEGGECERDSHSSYRSQVSKRLLL